MQCPLEIQERLASWTQWDFEPLGVWNNSLLPKGIKKYLSNFPLEISPAVPDILKNSSIWMYCILKRVSEIQLTFASRLCDFTFAVNLKNSLRYLLNFEHCEIYPSPFLRLQNNPVYVDKEPINWPPGKRETISIFLNASGKRACSILDT